MIDLLSFQKNLTRAFAGGLIAILAVATSAQAADPVLLGSHKDWKAYKVKSGSNSYCYAVSTPKDKHPKNVRRGDIFFMVTDWGNGQLQPSIIIGYPFKEDSSVRVIVGSDKFKFFTKDNGAWIPQGKESDEKRLISAMKRGSSMRVQGTSRRGTPTTDRYSLSGVTAALDKIKKNCN